MLNQIKDLAARQVTKVLASDATMKVLSSKQLKTVLVKAINLRAEARDAVEHGVAQVTGALDLVSKGDVAKLRRSIRDLEDRIADLKVELDDAQEQASEAKAQATAAVEAVEAAAENGAGADTEAAATPAKKKPAKKAKAAG